MVQEDNLKKLYRTHEKQDIPLFDFATPIIENKLLRDAFVAMHFTVEKHARQQESEAPIVNFIKKLVAYMGARQIEPLPEKKCLSRDIINYIRNHYGENITLDDFVELTSCNSFVLMRQFRKEIGCTPHDYLHMYRIARAKEHIARGNALSEVADLCGFADQSHLTRCFKRWSGSHRGNFCRLALNNRLVIRSKSFKTKRDKIDTELTSA